MNFDIRSTTYKILQVLIPVIVWSMFAGVPLHQYFTSPNLVLIFILGLFYSLLINQMFVNKPNLILILLLDIISTGLLIRLASSIGILNVLLIILGIILANSLIFTNLIDEPHCAWIIYSLICGPGIVFAIMIINNHFITMLNLIVLTLLIFLNALFTFPLFMSKPTWTFTITIAVITVLLALSIIPSVIKIISLIVLIGVFLFLQFKIKPNKFKTKS
ncbi:hypothetical protein [Lentilactobacillus kosonis]|uniref:Uncharacterized protein n=1 Tax=Lentilactobacillus kosonis TaxID=2810561 RepID=A0A401FK72_9LACO|nr:hypothetical protein [Lentilactobacillus kosonis]GAY72753.1 hypothetical protein NBRC111893_899 [Lentilactobacillus kosonis]